MPSAKAESGVRYGFFIFRCTPQLHRFGIEMVSTGPQLFQASRQLLLGAQKHGIYAMVGMDIIMSSNKKKHGDLYIPNVAAV